MIITEQIAKDLLFATKNKDTIKIQAIRLIIGSYTTYADKKDQITLDNIVSILKKLIDGEKRKLLFELHYITDDALNKIRTTYDSTKIPIEINKLIDNKLKENYNNLKNKYIEIWEEYLPNTPSKEEIILWIKSNIDVSKYKNILMAMKDISKQFPFNNKEELKIELLNYKEYCDNKDKENILEIPIIPEIEEEQPIIVNTIDELLTSPTFEIINEENKGIENDTTSNIDSVE